MRAFGSLAERYISKYYMNRSTFTGASYFFRLYNLAQCLDLLLLKKYSITRESAREVQKMFRDYWSEEVKNSDINLRKKKLMFLFNYCESKLPYVMDVFGRLETQSKELGLDSGFNPGKWKPLLIAIEEID